LLVILSAAKNPRICLCLAFAFRLSLLPFFKMHCQKNYVIPTEATHSLIVSGVVEEPPHFALAFAVVFVFTCHPSPKAEDLLFTLATHPSKPNRKNSTPTKGFCYTAP